MQQTFVSKCVEFIFCKPSYFEIESTDFNLKSSYVFGGVYGA